MKVEITDAAFQAISVLHPFSGRRIGPDTWLVEMPDDLHARVVSRLQPGESLSIGLIRGAIGGIILALQADGMTMEQIIAWLGEQGISAEFIRPS